MTLLDVYETPGAQDFLWQLLAEREPEQSISHKRMPTWVQHCAFIHSRPYEAWYLFESHTGFTAGATYLTRQREIGIGVLQSHRGQGLARQAITELMRLHPGRHLANINPKNEPSVRLFQSLGFGGPIQVTFAKETA